MKTTLISLRALSLLVLTLLAVNCSSSSDSGSSEGGSAGISGMTGQGGSHAGSSGTGQGGSNAGGTGAAAQGGSNAGTAGSNAGTAGSNAGAAGESGSGAGGSSSAFVYFVKQAAGTTTAALADGTISVSSAFGSSGNAFKYVAPNYYGTVSNGFIAFPTALTGDFSISAEITVSAQSKTNATCGIGVGMTTGFNGTDSYAYAVMRNGANAVGSYYVSAAGTVSAGAPGANFAIGTPLALSFSRTGSNVTYGAGPVGGTLTSVTTAASLYTNGTTVYGDGAVFPAISFNNVTAAITKLLIKDGTGGTVFDSATGALVNYVPASLTLSASAVDVLKGATTPLTATALAVGGTASAVTAVSADPTIATVTVSNGATNSTLDIKGLKGGATTVTVTNTSDSNSATNSKTIAVAVDDYAITDGYGSLATRAYPAPAAATAYTDGELSLTFDAPPVLNPGGSIKIFKLSDGSQVDSIGFASETQTFGTTSINVGSQLARIEGNTLFFTPHLGALAYGTAYYVAIPTTSITGTLTTVAFNGFSNLSTVATWRFTTRAAPTLVATGVTVDGSQTSTGNFRTVEGALNALATALPGAGNVTIKVAAGTYRELLRYTGPGAAAAQTISIVGPSNTRGDTCTIQFANGNTMNGSTQTRASAYFTGANLVLQNVTLKNSATRAAVSQAEALYFASGSGFTLGAFNSSFSSNQDTIQTSGRAWFYDCYIEGNVDFVWGTSDATLIENSSLRFVNDTPGTAASYSLFVARTGSTIAPTASGTVGKGYVLLNSTVSVDANVTAFFGRDAGTGAFYDQVALLNVTFTGAGAIGAGLWNVATPPLSLGDSSFIGWKSAATTGLNLGTVTTDLTKASATIAAQTTEYANRDQILNRVVTVTAGLPTGYQAAATVWDVAPLAAAWGL